MLGASGIGALGVGATGWITTTPSGRTRGGLVPDGTGTELAQPPILDSVNGRLQVDLTAAAGVRLAGRDTHALSYNGTSPGPTLRVGPGDQVAIRLTNKLTEPTNLHTHGLRVTPSGNSDNPFLRIDPGATFDYLIRIPPHHPAGTFWYHPHHHGTVANQIFGGLFGAILVEPAPAQAVNELAAVPDRVLLISDITLQSNGTVAAPSVIDRRMGRQGDLVLVNGQYQPTIPAAPGATQRWRLINTCVSRVLVVRLQDHSLIQIAQDGTYLPAPKTTEQVTLAPGNRADVIIHPRDAGRYVLTAEPFARGSMGMMGGNNAVSGPATLGVMNTQGARVNPTTLPTSLPAENPVGGPVTAQRQVAFQMSMGTIGTSGGGGMTFTIDGRTFDPQRDDQITTLGTVEEWTVTNTSPLAHPFHLHVWPFTVLATSDDTALNGVPQDVVLVPARGWVRLRVPFITFAGRSVYHCHILDHEDLGMMATINVEP